MTCIQRMDRRPMTRASKNVLTAESGCDPFDSLIAAKYQGAGHDSSGVQNALGVNVSRGS